MKTATVTEFRQNTKEHLQEIEADQDILILTRPMKNGKKSDFVVLTLEQYESMEETVHLLSTPANALRLLQGIKEAEQGKALGKDQGIK